ncbi:TSUP family transporter [Nocardia sp. NPDC051929]|uniref:TSUP family transporter n=1 Tax=Nocardia sp. NPDC051929 TaxID=3364327 RepID=UPI0037CA96E6
MPGAVTGALIRVFAFPAAATFKLVAAALLLALGPWLCLRTASGPRTEKPRPSVRSIATLALVVGVVGGIYGIGGGSLLSPILAGRGVPLAELAPAARTPDSAPGRWGWIGRCTTNSMNATNVAPPSTRSPPSSASPGPPSTAT